MLHDDSCKYLCSTCRWFVTIENYNFERERCNDCCSLTQDGEKRCVACNEFKHITLYEPRTDVKCKQCANAWRKEAMERREKTSAVTSFFMPNF
jgi:hypothetical protein